jgi:hypothetical protein
MQAVVIRIRFSRPCLGALKTAMSFNMLRDQNERVIFLPGWWREILHFGARLLGFPRSVVEAVEWDQIIDGNLSRFTRRGTRRRRPRAFAVHEAFLPGDIIGVRAVLPDGLSIDSFWRLLCAGGTYHGISPYRTVHRRYGTFEVISVIPLP